MPTILINTHLRQPAVNDSSKSVDSESQSVTKENFHNDFKAEINTIISKLMEKSETVAFLFMINFIEYDLPRALVQQTFGMYLLKNVSSIGGSYIPHRILGMSNYYNKLCSESGSS